MDSSLEEKLQQRAIAPTAMRLLVLEQLLQLKHAVSLNELESLFEKVDRVTLYRTLKTFEKAKLIHAIEDGTGSIKYALCAENCECAIEDVHAHFRCNRCNETFCLDHAGVSQLLIPKDFVVQKVKVILSGVCPSCTH